MGGLCLLSFIQCLHSVTNMNFTQPLHTCSLNLSQALPSFPTQYFMEFSCAHLQAQRRRISPPLSITLGLQLASVTRYPTTSRWSFLQYSNTCSTPHSVHQHWHACQQSFIPRLLRGGKTFLLVVKNSELHTFTYCFSLCTWQKIGSETKELNLRQSCQEAAYTPLTIRGVR